MYRKVLLAMDPEGLAESALPMLAALTVKEGGQVFVVAVARKGDPPDRRAAAAEHVRRAIEELQAAGIPADGEVREVAAEYSAADEIVGAAREWPADLVALGSRGHRRVAALLEGSVSRKVASAVEAAVVLVHTRTAAPSKLVAGPVQRILVAVDRKETSRQALKVALDLAREQGAKVLMLYIRELVPWGDIPYVESADEAQLLMQELTSQAQGAGVPVETRIGEPATSAASEIAKVAETWSADLIVLGSRRLTAVGGLLLGSVAQGVVHRTSRPVLLAGHPTHEATRGT